MMISKQQQYVAIAAVVLNIVAPMLLQPFATSQEVKPPNGAAQLSLKGQLMHMFVHHSQVPISSSIIIAVIILVAQQIVANVKL